LALVNTASFGLINGFVTTALFVLGPEKVDFNLKEAAGFMMVMGLLSGIFIGNLLALIF
jgi:hypothetical protein